MVAAAATMGLSVMVKGLIGVVLPSITIGIVMLLSRNRFSLKRSQWLGCITAFLIVAMPWHAAVEKAYPGALWYYVVEQQVLRYVAGLQALDVVPLGLAQFLALSALWSFP
jgi:4-amino-4-deoxy-L-arabinose transferase-like glycosyltransferase